MRYSVVVNYAGAVEIPLIPCHPASSSSSASTASSQQTPATFAAGSRLRGYNTTHRRRARRPTCSGRLLHPAQVLSVDLFSTNGRNCFGFVIILYSNRTGRPPPIPTVWPRRQPPPPPLQLPATDIPSSSTPPLFQFQAQPGGFDTGAEDQLAWDEFRVDDVLATMEGTLQ
jgi:hypothetical protein